MYTIVLIILQYVHYKIIIGLLYHEIIKYYVVREYE